ncbi:protein tyrosine phosphatase family protein [Uliginosibacterium sp. H3]|uniref:Protein tyrosine phosphatase family protein n=1 Tax=Uliginosibacterium silvisoli TaxID=3114758 RepID=A0ABU6K6W3_9RHOO|nr:protein tyrosine phosphatase family protein [Uliginosibacterium sp. H3]
MALLGWAAIFHSSFATMNITEIHRFVAIDDWLATAGQPKEQGLAAIAAAGFETIINLALHDDPRYSLEDEPGLVVALGMRYIHIPVQFKAPGLPELQAFYAAMAAHAGRKLFVHCASNYRVPVFLALYRIQRLGWLPDEAFAQMREVWEPDEVWLAFIEQALQATRQ